MGNLVYDNNLSFSYDFNVIVFDTETVATNDNFPSSDNPTAYMTHIQFSDYKAKKYILYTLKTYESFLDIKALE